MTCDHIVNVALKKVPGVDTMDVILNKGLDTVRLKPGTTVSVPRFWQRLHEKGYTPKATAVSVRGDLSLVQARVQLKVTGTKDMLVLARDPKNPGAYNEVSKKIGQSVIVQGVMVPGKD